MSSVKKPDSNTLDRLLVEGAVRAKYQGSLPTKASLVHNALKKWHNDADISWRKTSGQCDSVGVILGTYKSPARGLL